MRLSTRICGVGGVAIAGLLTTEMPAFAQNSGAGFYIRTDTGWSTTEHANFKQDNPNNLSECFIFDANGTTCQSHLNHLGTSPVVGAGFGYQYGTGWRTDVTITYRPSYNLHQTDPAGTAYDSDVKSLAVMINGFYDIPLGMGPLRPFIGAGIGFTNNKLSDISWDDCPSPGICQGKIPGGSETSFAWQAMLGAAFNLTDSVIVEMGYRYFDAGEFVKSRGNSVSWGGITDSARGDITAHEIMVNLRIPLSAVAGALRQ